MGSGLCLKAVGEHIKQFAVDLFQLPAVPIRVAIAAFASRAIRVRLYPKPELGFTLSEISGSRPIRVRVEGAEIGVFYER